MFPSSARARRAATAACAVAVVFGILFGGEHAAYAIEASRPPHAPPVRPGVDGLYPYSQMFAIGLYTIKGMSAVDPTVTNMRRVANAGFTLAGPYYDADWRDFSPIYAAHAEGLGFTYQVRPAAPLIGIAIDQRPAAINAMSDSDIAAGVREQVTAILRDPIARHTVARWSLGLEEVRYWKAPEMRYLRIASETIRAVESELRVDHRPFWMYEPNHRNVAALLKTGIYQDIVSKGVYLSNLPRGPGRSAYAMWSFSQIVTAAQMLNTIPQAVLQLSQDLIDPATSASAAEIRRVLRHDAYLGLMMGVKSLNIWSMHDRRPNLTTHSEQFEAYGSVAEDLTGELNLQQAFLAGTINPDIWAEVTQGTETLHYTDMYGAEFTFDTLHTYSAKVGDDAYLIFVNSTEEHLGVRIHGLPSSYLLDDLFERTTHALHQTTLAWQLEPLGVAALRFRLASAAAGAVGQGAQLNAVPEPWSAAILITGALLLWGAAHRCPTGNRSRRAVRQGIRALARQR